MVIDADLRSRLDRVAGKLATAAALPGEPVMFGAAAHQFRLGPPLPAGEVSAFEQQHGVTLPADYRAFITTVGHGGPGQWGGAGPYYGLHPIQNWDHVLWETPRDDTLATPFPAEPGRQYTDWPADVGLGDDDECYTGTLALSDTGCGGMAMLAVTGAGRGRVAHNTEGPDGPVFTPDPDFLAWYERWLDATLSGATHFW